MEAKSLTFLGLVALLLSCQSPKSKLTPEEVENLVADAYVHCFPIVENYKAVYFYGVLEASPFFTPMNTVKFETRLYTADDKAVVRANNDTYYSNGVLDLRAEPVIFKMPEANNRYYVFQLASQTTDNFNYIGTRSRGSNAAIYAVTGPDYAGKLPEGVIEIKAPSAFVGVVGRIGVNGEDSADREAAIALQNQRVEIQQRWFPDDLYEPQNAQRRTKQLASGT